MHLLQSGDIFLSRNFGGETANTSPGYWNHVGIFGGLYNTLPVIIEAQLGQGVIRTDLYKYFSERCTIRCVRLHYNTVQMGLQANNLVGLPYRRIASAFRFLRRHKGENCVSLARKAFIMANGRDPRWKIPDDIMHHPNTVIFDWFN